MKGSRLEKYYKYNQEIPNENTSEDTDALLGSDVEIMKSQLLAKGLRGEVYLVTAKVFSKSKKKSREVNLVKKIYQDPRLAKLAYDSYKKLKSLGIDNLFATYRLGRDGSSILMTNGNKNEQYCLAANGIRHSQNVTVEKYGLPKLKYIDNLEEVKYDLVRLATKASTAELNVHPHSYFFIVQPNSNEVKVILGDLDNIYPDPNHDPEIQGGG